MPAVMKGFLDRVLTPGYAFHEEGGKYTPLLTGRTAEVITTMDTPVPVFRFILHSPSTRAMALATLGFCGIRPARIHRLGPIKHSSAEKREKWLEAVAASARALPEWKAGLERKSYGMSWIKIARLQFYAMTMLAYGLGAGAATHVLGTGVDWWVFWLGFGVLFFLELASVLINELHDQPSDQQNRNHGPFNGGSRVLVEGKLPEEHVRRGRALALGVVAILAVILAPMLPVGTHLSAGLLLLLGLLLGPGYTAPPLRLSWRGWGEAVVAFTHSIYMLLAGWVLQGAGGMELLPWLLSLPMGLAILASILLAGVPDRQADRAAGKRTIAVRMGVRGAASLALACVVSAAVSAMVLLITMGQVPAWWLCTLFLAHGAGVAWLLVRFIQRAECRRIDGLLFLSLNFILWFSVYPLLNLEKISPGVTTYTTNP